MNGVKSSDVLIARNTVIPNPTAHTLRNVSVVLLLTQPYCAPNPKNNHQPVPYVEKIIQQATVAI
jgi:hypothetical protein